MLCSDWSRDGKSAARWKFAQLEHTEIGYNWHLIIHARSKPPSCIFLLDFATGTFLSNVTFKCVTYFEVALFFLLFPPAFLPHCCLRSLNMASVLAWFCCTLSLAGALLPSAFSRHPNAKISAVSQAGMTVSSAIYAYCGWSRSLGCQPHAG